MVPELAVTSHQPAVQVLRQTVDLDSNLIYPCGLLPQATRLVVVRDVADGMHKFLAQYLALLERPGLFSFLRQKVTRIELAHPCEPLACPTMTCIPGLQLA